MEKSGIKSYYEQKIEELEFKMSEKMQNIKRLEA